MDDQKRIASRDELPVCGPLLQTVSHVDGFVDLHGGKAEIPRLGRAAKLSDLVDTGSLDLSNANNAGSTAANKKSRRIIREGDDDDLFSEEGDAEPRKNPAGGLGLMEDEDRRDSASADGEQFGLASSSSSGEDTSLNVVKKRTTTPQSEPEKVQQQSGASSLVDPEDERPEEEEVEKTSKGKTSTTTAGATSSPSLKNKILVLSNSDTEHEKPVPIDETALSPTGEQTAGRTASPDGDGPDVAGGLRLRGQRRKRNSTTSASGTEADAGTTTGEEEEAEDENSAEPGTTSSSTQERGPKRRKSTPGKDVIPTDMQVVEFSDVEGFEGSNGEAPQKIGLEHAVEKVILSLLSPAIHGLQSIGIPSAQTRAEQLMAATPMVANGGVAGNVLNNNAGGDLDRTEICVRQIIAGSETRNTSRLLVDFFLDMVPFLGCPTILIKNTWAELRGIAIIAALYGHDLNTPRVQHEILCCLVPQGSPDQMATPADSTSVLLTDTAGKVAKAIIKNAVERATGLRLCADVVELATLMYNLYTPASQNRIEDESGFVHVGCTPTATARQYFRPKMLNSVNHVYVPLLLIGCVANQVCALLDLLFCSSWYLILPVVAVVSSAAYYGYRRLDEITWWFKTIPGWYLTIGVFGTHALLPMFSAFSSMQMVMPFALHLQNTTFEEFSVFLLGCANFLHLLLKKLNFANLHPVEKFLQKWNLSLFQERDASGRVVLDSHRSLKKLVNGILVLRRLFLIGCGCVFAVYSIVWMEYLGGFLFLGAGQKGLMLGRVVVRQRLDPTSVDPALAAEFGFANRELLGAGQELMHEAANGAGEQGAGGFLYGVEDVRLRDGIHHQLHDVLDQQQQKDAEDSGQGSSSFWNLFSLSTSAATGDHHRQRSDHERHNGGGPIYHADGTLLEDAIADMDIMGQDENNAPHSSGSTNSSHRFYHSTQEEAETFIIWEFLTKSRILMLAALSAWCQHHVAEVLRKREVLLKLVGAERIMANSLCLLLNGVAIISGTHITNLTLAEFLEKISPPAIVCCGIAAARSRALMLGFALSLFPAIEARFLPVVNYSGSFFTGVLLSGWAFTILGREYLKHGRSMEASHAYRLAYLMPGEVSDRTVAFLDEVVSRVRNRTMQYMAVNFLEKLFRFFLGRTAPVA